jgi:hypothetical protein
VPNERDEERASNADDDVGRGGTGVTPWTCGARAAASKRLLVVGPRPNSPRGAGAVAMASGSTRRGRIAVTGGAAPCATAVPGVAKA